MPLKKETEPNSGFPQKTPFLSLILGAPTKFFTSFQIFVYLHSSNFKGKAEQSKERSSVLPAPLSSSYWKGSFRVAIDYSRQLYFI